VRSQQRLDGGAQLRLSVAGRLQEGTPLEGIGLCQRQMEEATGQKDEATKWRKTLEAIKTTPKTTEKQP
jgi:hypothetical protein